MTIINHTMAAKRSDLPPIQIPKLPYYNGEGQSAMDSRNASSTRSPGGGLSIREIRESMPQTAIANNRNARPQPPAKKKQSLFGGLFQKEPSMAALHQVTVQMAAQHGGVVNAKTLPHVSSQKMPEHVPKVNTKWDGVPEAVRLKEKRARDKQRANVNPMLLSRAGSRVHDAADRSQSFGDRRHSIAESWDSRSTGSRLEFRDDPVRPDSIYSSSSGGSILQRKPTSVRSQSFRSPSGTSLPEITAFFPNEIPTASTMPRPYNNSSNSERAALFALDRGYEGTRHLVPSAPIEAIPEHTTSPSPSPQERSPRTPSLLSDGTSRNSDVPSSLSSFRKGRVQPIDAFLAGEAQLFQVPENSLTSDPALRSTSPESSGLPLIDRVEQDVQKRPDSSRARLGLRASMIVRTDALPWESQDSGSDSPGPQVPGSPKSPKSKRRLFSKEKK